MVQTAVQQLGLVSEQLTDHLNDDQLVAATAHIDAFVHPLGEADIRKLISMLPEDGDTASGLNWSILHSVEASPYWPLWDTLENESNEWIYILRLRLENGGFFPPGADSLISA